MARPPTWPGALNVAGHGQPLMRGIAAGAQPFVDETIVETFRVCTSGSASGEASGRVDKDPKPILGGTVGGRLEETQRLNAILRYGFGLVPV